MKEDPSRKFIRPIMENYSKKEEIGIFDWLGCKEVMN